MAAVLSNEGGYYPAGAYVSEARRMGLTLRPPDINRSAWRYAGANREIRMGLMSIKGLSPRLGERITSERGRGGSFPTFRDFVIRVRPEPDACARLIKAGAFDGVAAGLTRPALLWRLRAGAASRDASALPVPPEYDEGTRLRHEVESFGFPVSRHPLDLYADRLAGQPLVPASDLARHVGRRVRMAGWVVADKLTHTQGGAPMAFLTLEDQSAMYEAVLFPDVYAREAAHVFLNAACLVEGIADEDLGAVTLRLHRIRPLAPPPPDASAAIGEAAS
jgi:error-prone DNA polymerase